MTYFATVTSQGQVTIPAKLREKLGIKKNSSLIFKENDKGQIIIEKQRTLQQLVGIAKPKTDVFKHHTLEEIIKLSTQEYADKQSEKYFSLKDDE